MEFKLVIHVIPKQYVQLQDRKKWDIEIETAESPTGWSSHSMHLHVTSLNVSVILWIY